MKIILTADSPLKDRVAGIAVELGLEPVTSGNADDIMDRIRLHDCSIVLLDNGSNAIDGMELCREVRRQNSQEDRLSHIIMNCGSRDSEEVSRALRAGADDCVSSDISDVELRSRLSLAMRITGMEKKLLDLNSRLKLLVRTDSLTGLLNHAAILKELSMELDRAGRDGSPTSILMVDLDRFKLVNDSLGHQTGDRLLVSFANLLCRSCRSFDRIGRYGGEEFLVVLPRTTEEEAVSIAEMIRTGTEGLQLDEDSRSPGITCSVGCCTAEGSERHPSSMVAAVDSALFRAKESGRNRVVSCS